MSVTDQTLFDATHQGGEHFNEQSSQPAVLLQSIFRLVLNQPIVTDKAPSNFDKSLENACKSNTGSDPLESDPIEKIFLDAGFAAWFAFFLATTQNLVGKQTVSLLGVSVVKSIAKEVSATKLHVSIEALFRHLFESSTHSARRCRE
jgi:hypothetical protein